MNTGPQAQSAIEEDEPFIPYVSVADLDPSLKAAYEPHFRQLGFVPNAMMLYAHRPEIASTLLNLNTKIMRDPSSTLPLLMKRKIALICSTINGCAYCTAHSCSILKRPSSGDPLLGEGWALDREGLEGLIDGSDIPIDDIERVSYAYARAASKDPTDVSAEILDDLRDHMTPPQIVELATVVGFWKLFNTVHDSLAIPVEADLAGETGYVEMAPARAIAGAA